MDNHQVAKTKAFASKIIHQMTYQKKSSKEESGFDTLLYMFMPSPKTSPSLLAATELIHYVCPDHGGINVPRHGINSDLFAYYLYYHVYILFKSLQINFHKCKRLYAYTIGRLIYFKNKLNSKYPASFPFDNSQIHLLHDCTMVFVEALEERIKCQPCNCYALKNFVMNNYCFHSKPIISTMVEQYNLHYRLWLESYEEFTQNLITCSDKKMITTTYFLWHFGYFCFNRLMLYEDKIKNYNFGNNATLTNQGGNVQNKVPYSKTDKTAQIKRLFNTDVQMKPFTVYQSNILQHYLNFLFNFLIKDLTVIDIIVSNPKTFPSSNLLQLNKIDKIVRKAAYLMVWLINQERSHLQQLKGRKEQRSNEDEIKTFFTSELIKPIFWQRVGIFYMYNHKHNKINTLSAILAFNCSLSMLTRLQNKYKSCIESNCQYISQRKVFWLRVQIIQLINYQHLMNLHFIHGNKQSYLKYYQLSQKLTSNTSTNSKSVKFIDHKILKYRAMLESIFDNIESKHVMDIADGSITKKRNIIINARKSRLCKLPLTKCVKFIQNCSVRSQITTKCANEPIFDACFKLMQNDKYINVVNNVLMIKQCQNQKCMTKNVRLKRCRKCKSVFYCSKQCQKMDWKINHKKKCQEFATRNHSYTIDQIMYSRHWIVLNAFN